MVNAPQINYSPQSSDDYNVSVRLVAFVAISIALILISIYCIRTYASYKQNVLFEMREETYAIEREFYNDVHYSKYFLNLISRQLQNHYNDVPYIQKVLQDYIQSSNFNTLFGWRKYSWINQDFKEVVSSNKNLNQNQHSWDFLKSLMESDGNWRDKITFYTDKQAHRNNSLMIIKNIANNHNNNYVGSLVLSYDIAIMTRRLNFKRKNQYTNFVLLDKYMNVVTLSRPVITNIINKDEAFSPHLARVFSKINFLQEFSTEVSYLDMIGGINYYIKKIDGLPFIIIINLDTHEIRRSILQEVTRKLIEASAFTVTFIFVVLAIYRRETNLRSKAEHATLIANKATKAKSDFLAFTAHEIRSPLGFILTGSEIMNKELFGPLPLEYKKYSEGIYTSSHVILDFITDILDENQIIEGKFKIVNSIQSIDEIIEQAISINKMRFNNRQVVIESEISSTIPKLICDQRRILQVMNNLISNSIKYSSDGTKIIVSAMVHKGQLRIQVIDHGIGMSAEEIKVAFGTYGMVRSKHSSLIESYGLGLAIVKMLLDAHDAELTIKSKPNVGTTVEILFPKYKLIQSIQRRVAK